MLQEDEIHVFTRNYLQSKGWCLIAGQYPGGSDDDLYPLNIVDPSVARDASPDPRRHSKDKLVPDLVALRGRHLLLLEAKPIYSESDRQKLLDILTNRRNDLLAALSRFAEEHNMPCLLPCESLIITPVLAYSSPHRRTDADTGFVLLEVRSENDIRVDCEALSHEQ